MEVPLWCEGVGIEVLPPECARIVALVQEDAAGGGRSAGTGDARASGLVSQ
ncbi:hypothetical protein GXW82_25470 [Streptacidiphilus sp. 4-A2]|nr:hypothetical protein [Streptacidiphilus sp. 4-A2]